MTGVPVNIFRWNLGDCTNRGATSPEKSKGKTVVVFDPAIKHGNFNLDECKDDPRFLCLRVVRRWEGTDHEYLHCVQIGTEDGAGMSGGNFVYSSDSRFSDVARYPLSVHDRFES